MRSHQRLPAVTQHFFQKLKVEFIRRQINMTAHVLARVAPSLPSFYIFTDLPVCIHNIVINEMF
jgi:hypothetical protein